MGSTCHNATQKFSTLVLRAGRTTLPSLRVQACDTPLTQQAFAVGLLMPLRWFVTPQAHHIHPLPQGLSRRPLRWDVSP